MLLTLPNVVRRDTMVRTSKTFAGNATRPVKRRIRTLGGIEMGGSPRFSYKIALKSKLCRIKHP